MESLIREKARKAGCQVSRIYDRESGSPRGDYTLLKRGYVVISPVSLEEINDYLTDQEAANV